MTPKIDQLVAKFDKDVGLIKNMVPSGVRRSLGVHVLQAVIVTASSWRNRMNIDFLSLDTSNIFGCV